MGQMWFEGLFWQPDLVHCKSTITSAQQVQYWQPHKWRQGNHGMFLQHSNLDDCNVPKPDDLTKVDQTLSEITILNKDIADLITCLHITNIRQYKALGPDQVSNAMLKMAA